MQLQRLAVEAGYSVVVADADGGDAQCGQLAVQQGLVGCVQCAGGFVQQQVAWPGPTIRPKKHSKKSELLTHLLIEQNMFFNPENSLKNTKNALDNRLKAGGGPGWGLS